MIRKITVIFCDNDHGNGDVTYPDLATIDQIDAVDLDGQTVSSVRKMAKEQGWGRVNGADYCPGCMASL